VGELHKAKDLLDFESRPKHEETIPEEKGTEDDSEGDGGGQ
jgi:hypothetical protein